MLKFVDVFVAVFLVLVMGFYERRGRQRAWERLLDHCPLGAGPGDVVSIPTHETDGAAPIRSRVATSHTQGRRQCRG